MLLQYLFYSAFADANLRPYFIKNILRGNLVYPVFIAVNKFTFVSSLHLLKGIYNQPPFFAWG